MDPPDRKQLAKELHKRPVRKFRRRITMVPGIGHTWAADLVDMGEKLVSPEPNKFRYILTVIDCLSRKAWVIPLARKTKVLVGQCFQKIFEHDPGRKPTVIWVDRGGEFNEKEIGVPLRFAYGVPKVGIIERFNKTLKNRMWFELTLNESSDWAKALPAIVKDYNNTVHSSIGIEPRKAWEAGPGSKIERILLQKQHLKALRNKYRVRVSAVNPNDEYGIDAGSPLSKTNLKPGDRVRIVADPPKSGDMFHKGYKPQWSTEIYTVKEVLNNFDGPPMYAVQVRSEPEHQDRSEPEHQDRGTILNRHYYEQELQKSSF